MTVPLSGTLHVVFVTSAAIGSGDCAPTPCSSSPTAEGTPSPQSLIPSPLKSTPTLNWSPACGTSAFACSAAPLAIHTTSPASATAAISRNGLDLIRVLIFICLVIVVPGESKKGAVPSPGTVPPYVPSWSLGPYLMRRIGCDRVA